jgi:hypothetical protein
MMPMPNHFRHLMRVLCLIFAFYMIAIECGISFDAYLCWRKMLIEDCFCSAPWRTYKSKNELSEREQLRKISYAESVSIMK